MNFYYLFRADSFLTGQGLWTNGFLDSFLLGNETETLMNSNKTACLGFGITGILCFLFCIFIT